MKATYLFSSAIGSTIERYINLKRSLGRAYTKEYALFKHLDEFLNTIKSDLATESFEAWCRTQQHLTTGSRRKRRQKVHRLCLYRQRTEPSCFIPNPLLFPRPNKPIQPYIFTENDIIKLYNEIKKMRSNHASPLRKENFKLGLVLLYTTGLRLGELVRLTIKDYNPVEHLLLIRESKFHKSRIVPLSEDAWREIEDYLKIRRNFKLPTSTDLPLIWHNNHTNKTGFYTVSSFSTIFNSLFKNANIHTLDGRLPRSHDMRHSFAVHALLRWYHEGANVQAKLPMLSTYMGHSSVASTQYYLRFIDQVVSSASKRFEDHYSAIVALSNKGDVL